MNTRQKILKIFRALMFSMRLNFIVYVHCTAYERNLECNMQKHLHKRHILLYIIANVMPLKCQYTYTQTGPLLSCAGKMDVLFFMLASLCMVMFLQFAHMYIASNC